MSEGTRAEPALTDEEWLGCHNLYTDAADRDWFVFEEATDGQVFVGCDDHSTGTHPEQRHALAALALHNQSFGFTWEDVDRLRGLEYMHLDRHEDGPTIASIADRIAALLPPRED